MNFSFKNMKFWSLFCADNSIDLKLSTTSLKYKCVHCNEINIGALSFVRNREVDFDLENGTTQLNLCFECVECKKQNNITFLIGHKENINKITTQASAFIELTKENKGRK